MSQLPFFRSTTSLIILFFLSAISSSHADTFEYSDVPLNQERHKDDIEEQKHDEHAEHDEHPLLLPSRAASGQWTTDIWSRNDGFIANSGIRVKFGH
ncbi:hypothetical protein C7Y69_11630 [Alteromonas sp. KS69]|jgi:hypothetical protein|uniref:hypothetical protein n=1 Tax=Alteromonas sp. KS69 TaxID=2109917 RepID=UPI000F88083C|nr:hypothetical protein [Alteromonas sp. KS69]RUP79968.1 hypothetical protein C7Y69_11630 [Alteromonas sp. KS69]